MGRRTGCERPFTQEQMTAIVGQIALSALFYVVCVLSTQRQYLVIPLVLYSVPLAALLLCWVYCIVVDPSKPGGIPCSRMAVTQARERWCRICYKSVPGLDHHCTWLNTCIGKRTYVPFVCLAMAGTAQYVLQLLLCIVIATVWRVDDITAGYYVFLAVVAGLGVVGISAFGSLAAFHAYLLYRGFGTYDWILERAEKRAMMLAPPPPLPAPPPPVIPASAAASRDAMARDVETASGAKPADEGVASAAAAPAVVENVAIDVVSSPEGQAEATAPSTESAAAAMDEGVRATTVAASNTTEHVAVVHATVMDAEAEHVNVSFSLQEVPPEQVQATWTALAALIEAHGGRLGLLASDDTSSCRTETPIAQVLVATRDDRELLPGIVLRW